jgi:antitoxin MazE
MGLQVRSKLVKIGNSQGIRIPRPLLEQLGLEVGEEVEMRVEEDRLFIQAARKPRQGWDIDFTRMATEGDDTLLDEILSTAWDAEEWEW